LKADDDHTDPPFGDDTAGEDLTPATGGDDRSFESYAEFDPATPDADTKPEPEVHTQFVGTGMFWGLVVGVILAIVVIGFAAQNTQAATVEAIVWEWSSPLFVVVLISVIMGIVLDEIVGLLFRARRRRLLAEKAELRRLRGDD
jgi:uncharacterized integral membrane protein